MDQSVNTDQSDGTKMEWWRNKRWHSVNQPLWIHGIYVYRALHGYWGTSQGNVQGLHDLTNVEGTSWKANGHFQVIGLYVTSQSNIEAFSYVTIYYEIFRVRAFLLSTRDRNLLVEFMTLLKDGEMRSLLVNGVEINSSG